MFHTYIRTAAHLVGAAVIALSISTAGAAPPDLNRMVVIGDSLSAGFQNYSLYDSNSVPGTSMAAIPGGQTFGFAAVVAKQAGVDLHLPLISYPGIPPVLLLEPGGILGRGTTIGFRDPQTLNVQTRNLSVPGFLAADVLLHSVKASSLTNPAAANLEDVLAIEVLGYPSLNHLKTLGGTCGVFPLPNGEIYLSQTECAAQLRPSVVLASVGANDVLQAVLDGVSPTSVRDFKASYALILGALRSEGARLVVSNVPDVTALPVLLPYAAFEATCGFAPMGATPADYVVPHLSNPTAFAFSICTNYVVRSASLVAEAKTAVKQYNKIIEETAELFGGTVVDVNGLFKSIAKNGYNVPGHHLTTRFLGGIFSLDGVHPTNTGYAILANAFITAMNSDLGTHIPRVSIPAVAATDPLVF